MSINGFMFQPLCSCGRPLDQSPPRLSSHTVGIYGVISYSVSQRIQEMGIGMALGAQAADVRWMIVRQGMWSTMVGVGAGVGVSLAVTRAIKSMLYGVKASDPITLGAVVLILCGVALAASWIPARRASRVDPIIALHYE